MKNRKLLSRIGIIIILLSSLSISSCKKRKECKLRCKKIVKFKIAECSYAGGYIDSDALICQEIKNKSEEDLIEECVKKSCKIFKKKR